MPRSRRDHRPAHEEEAGATRVERPPSRPQDPVLALQRTAGNRAVSALIQRLPEGTTAEAEGPRPVWDRVHTWDDLWSYPGARAELPPPVGIGIVEAALTGHTPELDDYDEDPALIGLTKVMLTVLANDRRVSRWRVVGCGERVGDRIVVHRPAPAEAVAGWLGITAPLPQYLPDIEPDLAEVQPAGDPAPVTDPALKTGLALQIATYLIENKLGHQVYLARGITDEEQQRLATKVLAALIGRLPAVTDMVHAGMHVTQPDGSRRFMRPAPPEAIAARLGIGPRAEENQEPSV